MARASMYYYNFQPYCVICQSKTDHTWILHSADTDLDYSDVEIAIHPFCHFKNILRSIIISILIVAAIWLIMTLLESVAFIIFKSIPVNISNPLFIPCWLVVINSIIAGFFGLRYYARDRFRFRDLVEREIRLNSFPID